MGGAVGIRGGLVAPYLLALIVSGLVPGATRAAEGAEILPGDPHAAVVADVDGDGAADLVRVQVADARRHVVDAWSRDEGAWERIGSAPIPRLHPSGGDERSVPGTDASASRSSTEYASIAQAKSGMRIHVIPGARMLWIVTMKLIAPASDAIDVRWMPRIHRSCPTPGLPSLLDSGT